MNLIPIALVSMVCVTNAVRLHKLFQYVDGFKSDYQLQGFLHLGVDYAVFLRAPKPHSKYLVYELYETKKIADSARDKPKILAISKVPVEYVREQLRLFRDELYKAKYIDENVIPGTQVKTLREWQIEKAFKDSKGGKGLVLADNESILRSIVRQQ